jgi:5'-methylthioadenosine phosphorylase
MTNLPEARLAREAEMCYGTVALATDYDCWHEGHDDVSVEAVIAIIQQNVATAKQIIKTVVQNLILQQKNCHCDEALKFAIMTDKSLIPSATQEALKPIIGKYLG